MRRKLLPLLAIPFVLTACGAPAGPAPEQSDPAGVTSIGDSYNEITEVEVKLKNGDTITCLVFMGDRKGGLDCLEQEPRDR